MVYLVRSISSSQYITCRRYGASRKPRGRWTAGFTILPSFRSRVVVHGVNQVLVRDRGLLKTDIAFSHFRVHNEGGGGDTLANARLGRAPCGLLSLRNLGSEVGAPYPSPPQLYTLCRKCSSQCASSLISAIVVYRTARFCFEL